MRRIVTAVSLTVALCSTAYADCKGEVATALERQRKSSGFRMETSMISEDGRVHMTVDYVLPDRMHQIIKSEKDPVQVETIVVGNFAWTRHGDEPWMLLNPKLTSDLVTQMQETLGDDPGELGTFNCLGKQAVSGTEFLAYQGENDPGGPKNMTKEDPNKPKDPGRPVRVIYVDPTTGLPMKSIFARANLLEKPIFEANYSYPVDIKIDAPAPERSEVGKTKNQ
jgi:hypothetical protein